MKKKIITIARSYGSGGRTLGIRLAKELGIPYYDRSVLRIASDRSGINEALFNEADEKIGGKWFFRGSNPYKGELLPPGHPDYTSRDNLFNIEADTIKKLADQGPCIFIGRCADFVLKEREDILRLFFYAPMENCIARAKEVHGEEEPELIKKINRIDKYRAEYYKYYTGHEWNDSRNYDFCLNTSSMSYEKLIEVVKEYIKIQNDGELLG